MHGGNTDTPRGWSHLCTIDEYPNHLGAQFSLNNVHKRGLKHHNFQSLGWVYPDEVTVFVFVIICIQTSIHVSCCVMSCRITCCNDNSTGVKFCWCQMVSYHQGIPIYGPGKIREFLFVSQGISLWFPCVHCGFPVFTLTCDHATLTHSRPTSSYNMHTNIYGN